MMAAKPSEDTFLITYSFPLIRQKPGVFEEHRKSSKARPT